MKPRPLVEVDGWLTDDPDELRSFTVGPRPGLASWLKRDVRSWKPWTMWAVAAGGAVVGGWLQRPELVVIGAAVLLVYLRMLWMMVRSHKAARLVEAVVWFDRRHPHFPELVTGKFTERNGPTTGAACFPVWAAEATARADGSHEVLVAYDSTALYQPVVGVRRPPAPGVE